MSGGKRECGPGYTDLGLTCTKLRTYCASNDRDAFGNCWAWDLKTDSDTYGKYDDEFTAAFDQVGNFFKNLPETVKAAFAPNGPLANVFDPNMNGISAAMRKIGGDLLEAFDPEKNGVAAAFRKFKQDTEGAFEEIGKKLKDTFSAEKINAAFAPFVAMMNSFGESVSNYFSDPSNIVSFICILMTTAASALPPPLSNALSVLAACTKMIGDAALGKPFDPMDLMDLGQAFVVPPQAKLAATIAKTTSKATTILGRVAATANAVGKAAVSEAKTVAKNVSKMSAKDKALLLGKTIVKVSGKVAGGANGPVDSQQTASQNRADEEIADEVIELLDDDPAAVERGEEFMAQQNKEDQDEAYRRVETAGTEAGEVRDQMKAAIDEAEPYFVEQETEPSLDAMVQTATEKPKSYGDPEKTFFYGEKADAEFANETKASASQLEAIRNKKIAAEAKRTGQTQAAVAKGLEIKEKNEKRKYGLTQAEAEANLNVAQGEIQQFQNAYSAATSGSPLLGGGDELPPFYEQNIEYSGEDLPGNNLGLKIFKTIRTPTFKSFLKNKLENPPQVLKSDDWYPAYKKFMDWYSKSKTDYNALLAANATAIAAYRAKPRAEVEEAMDAVLNQQRDPNNPPAPTPAAVPLTPQQEFNVKLADFYNGNKFLYATGEYPNLSLEAYNQQMANSGKLYAVTPGFDLETLTQKPGYDNSDGTWVADEPTQPEAESATSFYGDEPTGGMSGGAKKSELLKVAMEVRKYFDLDPPVTGWSDPRIPVAYKQQLREKNGLNAKEVDAVYFLAKDNTMAALEDQYNTQRLLGQGKKKRHIRDFFGGSLLVPPPKDEILKYYTSVFVNRNPDIAKPDELAMLKQYEIDWKRDPAGTLALMNAFKAQVRGSGEFKVDRLPPFVPGKTAAQQEYAARQLEDQLRDAAHYYTYRDPARSLGYRIVADEIYEMKPTIMGLNREPLNPGHVRAQKIGMDRIVAGDPIPGTNPVVKTGRFYKKVYEPIIKPLMAAEYAKKPPATRHEAQATLEKNLDPAEVLAAAGKPRKGRKGGVKLVVKQAPGVNKGWDVYAEREWKEFLNGSVKEANRHVKHFATEREAEIYVARKEGRHREEPEPPPDSPRSPTSPMRTNPTPQNEKANKQFFSLEPEQQLARLMVNTKGTLELNPEQEGLVRKDERKEEQLTPKPKAEPSLTKKAAKGKPRRRKGGEDPPDEPSEAVEPEEDPEPEPVAAALDDEKEARVQAILADTEKKGSISDAVRKSAMMKIGKDMFTIDLPDALEQYLAANAKDKRVKRAKIHALMAFTDAKFGTLSEIQAHDDDATTSLAWYQPAMDWIASLEEKAPELLNKGTDATPETVYKASPTAIANEEARKKVLEDINKTTAEADEIEQKNEMSDKQYQEALKTYEASVAAAEGDEEVRTQLLKEFNDNFPADDPRRLQGSGKPGPTLVMRNLYLGNKEDAANKKFLRKARIHKVFNCTRNVPETKSAGVSTVRFALDDSPEDVSVMKEKGAEWANQVMEAMVDGPVLIHCVEGRQRSPAITALVLALHKPKRGKNAMKAVRAKRPFAFTPQANFEEAIKRWLG